LRQIALKRRVDAWLGKRRLSPSARAFNGSSRLEWWRRLFLPTDFAELAVLCCEENLECREYVTEHLTICESFRTATIKVGEARKYHRYPGCHPREFRNQRITFIDNEEKLKCHRCKGIGKIDCSPEVRCPSCKGRRTRNEFCFACGGSGRASQDHNEQCWSCRGRGTRSQDCAACAGVYSSSTGRVRCNRCGGAGWVVCRTCEGAGEKVRATLIARRYSHSTERHYQLGGLAAGIFGNGLAPHHFKSIPGCLVHQEYQTPSDPAVILQRLGVYSYPVESKTYRYKGAEFHVNRIATGNGARLVSRNLPWSLPKLITAGVIGSLTVCLLAALLLVS